MDKNKPKKDNVHNVHKELEISDIIETGRRELDLNQQKYQDKTNQHHMQQADLQTRRRSNNNKQQEKFNTDRVVVQHQQKQKFIVSIPTKNTYIDLEVQKVQKL